MASSIDFSVKNLLLALASSGLTSFICDSAWDISVPKKTRFMSLIEKNFYTSSYRSNTSAA